AAATPHVSWSCTATSVDQADLFRVTLQGDGYLYDGVEKAFVDAQPERVFVDGGATVILDYRLTEWGPIVVDDGGGTYAAAFPPLVADPGANPVARDPITAFVAAIRATTRPAFVDALADWTVP